MEQYSIARNYVFRVKNAGTWKWLLAPLARERGATNGN